VDYGQVWLAMTSADLRLLGMAGLSLVSTFAIRSWRWQSLLQPIKQVRFSTLMTATSIGLMANMIFPARLGELVRALVLGRQERMETSTSLATIVVERIYDGLTILLMLAALLFFVPLPLSESWVRTLQWGGMLTLLGYLGVCAMLYYLYRATAHAVSGVRRLERFLPRQWPEKLGGLLASFSHGLLSFSRRKSLGRIVFSSILLWTVVGLYNFLVVLAFHLPLPLAVGFLLVVFQAFAVMIPSSPGFVGTYHVASVACLKLWNVTDEAALSVALVMHAMTFFLTIGMGFGCLWSVRGSLREFIRPNVIASPPSLLQR
jgi:uncharacterized protein (TIRG00374 family)